MKCRISIYNLCRILFCLDMCEIIIFLLNRKYGESWKLFFYNLKEGFVYCKEYAVKFWLVIGFFLFLCTFFLLFIKDKFSFEWRIRVGNKRFAIGWKYQFIFPCLLVLFLLFTGGACRGVYEGQIRYNLWQGSSIVGHSFGRIDRYTYTGSKEAFEKNYEKGYRTFEVDLAMTSDGKMVLRHDWDQPIQEGISSENIPTQEEFLAVPIYQTYTPLSFYDLCLIMQKYPDIWIVTDSKYTGEEDVKKQFNSIVSTAKECNAEEVLDRLIIQIYNESMYEVLKEVHPFKSYIFTLYKRWDGNQEEFAKICRWCVEHDVDVITMWDHLWNEEIRTIAERYKRDVYVHTVNDAPAAVEFLKSGVRGIYTDGIRPEELEEKE